MVIECLDDEVEWVTRHGVPEKREPDAREREDEQTRSTWRKRAAAMPTLRQEPW